MIYCDAHCHLMPDDVFLNAHNLGVKTFFVNSTTPDDWLRIVDLGRRVLGVHVCAGVHPWFVDALPPDWNRRLERFLTDYPDAMIGEIGLDTTRPFYPLQKRVFQICLDIASRYRRKVHIHCVKAWDDLFEILGQYRDVQPLFHRFSGDEVIVQKLRLFNAYFSVTNGRVINVIPDNRLLVETDAPDGLKDPACIPELVRSLHLDVNYLQQNLELFLYDV